MIARRGISCLQHTYVVRATLKGASQNTTRVELHEFTMISYFRRFDSSLNVQRVRPLLTVRLAASNSDKPSAWHFVPKRQRL